MSDEKSLREIKQMLDERFEDGSEYIEVDPDDLTEIEQAHAELRALQQNLGALTLEFQQKKQQIEDEASSKQDEIQQMLDELRQEYDLPEDADYELSLPSEEGEKGLFYKE